jgi:hypothetical protein
MLSLWREVEGYCPFHEFAFVGYVFSVYIIWYGVRSVSNNGINFSDHQQEQQNVAAYKLSSPNNFAGLKDVYWNL